MNKTMTNITVSYSIRDIKYKLRKFFYRLNMMSIEITTFIIATLLASVIISFIYGLSPLLIFRGIPISFFVSSIVAIFIGMMSFAEYSIHRIIGSNHPFSLSFDSRMRFFGQATIPRWYSFEKSRCSFGLFIFSFIIIFPLKSNSVMNGALRNIKSIKKFLCCTIINFQLFSYLSHRYFVSNIPSINEVFQRFRMQLGKFLNSCYKYMFVMTFSRTINNLSVFSDMTQFAKKGFIAYWTIRIFPFFHNYILSNNKLNVYVKCRCTVVAHFEEA